jgi:hypothetical protein
MSVATPTGFETNNSVEELSNMIIAYFRAYAQDKISQQTPPEKTIYVRPQGKLRHTHVRVWLVEPTMWYVVDNEGKGYERSVSAESGSYAKALPYDYLRKQSVKDLKKILDSFDPWRKYQ